MTPRTSPVSPFTLNNKENRYDMAGSLCARRDRIRYGRPGLGIEPIGAQRPLGVFAKGIPFSPTPHFGQGTPNQIPFSAGWGDKKILPAPAPQVFTISQHSKQSVVEQC